MKKILIQNGPLDAKVIKNKMKVIATIKILIISLIEPFKWKPDRRYDKQARGDGQCEREKAQHFKIVSDSSLV